MDSNPNTHHSSTPTLRLPHPEKRDKAYERYRQPTNQTLP
jgi:hypothetical protein